MRFTDRVKRSASPCETLQIFSVKVAGIKEGVHWPLYVYGKVAVRDTVDRKRNIIFDRTRDNFQTVTEQVQSSIFLLMDTIVFSCLC